MDDSDLICYVEAFRYKLPCRGSLYHGYLGHQLNGESAAAEPLF